MLLDNFSQMLGRVQIGHYDPDGNLVSAVPTECNLVTFGGTEVLSRILAGQSQYKINGVYFQFSNQGSPAIPSFTRGTVAADMRTLTANEDYVLGTLAGQPSITTGDSTASGNPYSDNRAVFFSLATASVGEGGVAFTAGAGSKIISLGLVATPVSGDRTQDILYARFAPASAVDKQSGLNPGITWTTEFL